MVVHTTDMAPGTFNALVKAWQSKPGAGNAAHFLIGRNEADGVVQFAPITRNANHAGGSPSHGWWKYKTPAGGKLVHPNTVAVGIEIDNAGKLRRVAKSGGRYDWYYRDGEKFVFIPEDEVSVDERGQGWHTVTAYQRDALAQLLRDLHQCLMIGPELIVPNGDYKQNGCPWAEMTGRIVGHATLDPNRKTDPGPFVTAWLKAEGWIQ